MSVPKNLIRIGFATLGLGYALDLFRRDDGEGGRGDDLTPSDMVKGMRGNGRGSGRGSFGQLGASRSVPAQQVKPLVVKDGIRTIKFYPAGSIDNRVKFIVGQIRKDARDPKTITEARAIVSGKCQVERGGKLDWCLPAGTLVVRKPYELVPIEQVQVGDMILGDGDWTEVRETFDRGVQPILAFHLNNGSTLRCSPEHKLFVVPRRTRRGKVLPRDKHINETFPGKREDAIEIKAKDIREGDELLQPESIPFGKGRMNVDQALIMGAYIAEGWLEPSRASIAGIPNSKGVREKVIEAADRLEIPHSEDRFKVRLRGRSISEWLASCGKLAANKQIPTIDLDRETLESMLVGLNADASFVDARKKHMPKFCTTSPVLAQQYRLIYRMLGHSASVSVSVPEGFSPLYTVAVRTKDAGRGGKAWAKVKRIEEQPPEHTFDLETASNRIYLPECDVVVHNCIKQKDWRGELKALFFAVTDPNSKIAMRYTRDPWGYDAFGSSESHRRLPSGDCFVHGTLVLRDDHKLVPVETLRVDDRIWGIDGWTPVLKTWDKGVLPTWLIKLNNGSTVRLTPNHKVWVLECEKHPSGTNCTQESCPLHERTKRVVSVSELTTKMILIQPDRIDAGSEPMDSEEAWIEGVFVADGWIEGPTRFAIAGKDGHPKEEQKRRVRAFFEARGIRTVWNSRFIRVYSREWVERLSALGVGAANKRVASLGYNPDAVKSLVDGVMADASTVQRAGQDVRCLTTTSRDLFVQARVLLKTQGITCSERFIRDHGGLGRNPIWRLQERVATENKAKGAKLLRVKEIVRDNLPLPCFDFETGDKHIWLPEADWTVHNCDDFTIRLGALCYAIGYPVRARVVAPAGAPNQWAHIYLMVGDVPGEQPEKWLPLDPTEPQHPPFWEVPKHLISNVKDFDV